MISTKVSLSFWRLESVVGQNRPPFNLCSTLDGLKLIYCQVNMDVLSFSMYRSGGRVGKTSRSSTRPFGLPGSRDVVSDQHSLGHALLKRPLDTFCFKTDLGLKDWWVYELISALEFAFAQRKWDGVGRHVLTVAMVKAVSVKLQTASPKNLMWYIHSMGVLSGFSFCLVIFKCMSSYRRQWVVLNSERSNHPEQAVSQGNLVTASTRYLFTITLLY